MAAEDGSLLKSVIHWNDFFATSECRDLLFHVQEHHITLREIKLFLAATGVQFGGFMLDAHTFQRFATRAGLRNPSSFRICCHVPVLGAQAGQMFGWNDSES